MISDDILDAGAIEDSTVQLVGVTKKTSSGSQEITYLTNSNKYPTFIFEEKADDPDTPMSGILIASIVLGIVFLLVTIVVIVVLVRRRNSFKYSELH